MTQMDTDVRKRTGLGNSNYSHTAKLMSTYEISNERITGQQLKEIGPQADEGCDE